MAYNLFIDMVEIPEWTVKTGENENNFDIFISYHHAGRKYRKPDLKE